ncbi:MAG: DNA alkylation repair protein, partial [Gemmatimonadota bacterium]
MTAPKLKDFFDATIVGEIARSISRAHPPFNARAFTKLALDGLTDLELIARGWHIAEALREFLPAEFPQAAQLIIASLGPELSGTDGWGMAPFRYLPHILYVQKYGLDHFEAAMHAQYELTKRFSAEGSIRQYLLKYPDATYERLTQWVRDPSPHVRRLVSEGTRPRLPWAPRLRAFQEDPRPVIALLELLKDDPDRYVQRSIANNLNDIGKDNPAIAVEVCRRWIVDAPPGRAWLVRHALRALVKQGYKPALALLGVGEKAHVRVGNVQAPRRVRIGETARFSFDLVSTGADRQDVLVDYAVHFVKANGAARPKVFKLRRVTLAPK